jgi:hypothetical protein
LQVLCIEQTPSGDARDCSSLLRGSFEMTLGWSVLSARFDAHAQLFERRQGEQQQQQQQQQQQNKAQKLPFVGHASDTAVGELLTSSSDTLAPNTSDTVITVGDDVGLGVPRGVPGDHGEPRFLFAQRMEF